MKAKTGAGGAAPGKNRKCHQPLSCGAIIIPQEPGAVKCWLVYGSNQKESDIIRTTLQVGLARLSQVGGTKMRIGSPAGVDPLQTLSTKEVCKLLGITKVTFYKLCREGKLPVIRVGHQYRVPRVALQRWLEKLFNNPVSTREDER